MRRRWVGVQPGERLALEFQAVEQGAAMHRVKAEAVVLALGGASWPQTGSTGLWEQALSSLGVHVFPLVASNCGWECHWPPDLLERCEGRPLKNLRVAAGNFSVRGELLLTRYGLEGGALYALGAALRALAQPILTVDFKPDSTAESLLAKLGTARRNFLKEASSRWRLGEAVSVLLEGLLRERPPESAEEMVRAVKQCEVRLDKARPVAEAISSAGGLCLDELDETLMLRRYPGLFAAGEMLAWDAPTGGYLLQGCFSTGTRAGDSAWRWAAGS